MVFGENDSTIKSHGNLKTSGPQIVRFPGSLPESLVWKQPNVPGQATLVGTMRSYSIGCDLSLQINVRYLLRPLYSPDVQSEDSSQRSNTTGGFSHTASLSPQLSLLKP